MISQKLEQFYLIQSIRNFFNERGFIDVMTPPMVQNPGMETHIHPFKVKSAYQNRDHELYLHTSPEFAMKQLLSEGLENIFTITYSFRDEPSAPHHRNQFIMLEWYRSHSTYKDIMDDVEDLILSCADFLSSKNIKTLVDKNTPFKRITVQDLFKEFLGFDILEYLERDKLREYMSENFSHISAPNDPTMTWDDYYFLLFLNEIEPKLEKYPYLLIYEFPHHLSALSTLKATDERVCERFEVYMNGVELCNAFNELRDLEIQKRRFDIQKEEKESLYNYTLPEAAVLYDSLEKGFPPAGGIALGVERLLMALTGTANAFWD